MAQSQAHVGPDLFTPVEAGPLHLKNRVVMAPLTRSRAAKGNVPTALMPFTMRSAPARG